jgi:sporulation protein YlmC with PRC-barrel domain
MKRNLKELTGYHIGATDGEVGRITDFLFDKTSWTIRYLVVETGNWLLGRKVLLSPQALQGVDHDQKVFKVNLTVNQVKNSPDINTEQPVNREHEEQLHQYYPWAGYWKHDVWPGSLGTVGMMAPAVAEPMEDAVHKAVNEDATQSTDDLPQKTGIEEERDLFTTGNVKDYAITATNGDIGDVEGFIVDDSSWKIEQLIVDTGKWLPGKKVLLSPDRVRKLDWLTSQATVDVTTDEIKNYPEYDADKLMTDTN